MLDRGVVIKVEGKLARVGFVASSECAKCGACSQARSGQMVVEAENPVGAKAGETVEVEISPMVKAVLPLVVFGIPIVLLFAGIVIGGFISETAGMVVGIIFLLHGFLIVRLIDRYAARSKRFAAKIIRVVGV